MSKFESSQVNNEEQQDTYGWAAYDSSGILSPFKFSRRANGENDITIKILYTGICHTDLHFVRNDFGITNYPVVPGHEIVGEVTTIGPNVTKFKTGDKAGVGCWVGSCRACENCTQDLENYCPKAIMCYNANAFQPNLPTTYGGYSNKIVIDQHFAVKIPSKMPLESTAPLLCAGITVYSPMMYYGLNRAGLHVGVVGLGGLGHVAVKFAKALGLKVTVISTSVSKKEESLTRLDADSFLLSPDPRQMEDAKGTMDGIIDTVSADHSLIPLVDLLKVNGKLVCLGAPKTNPELPMFSLLMGRKLIGGSGAGGMKETQEMIDFAAKHKITADVEVIPMDYVNEAMDRLAKGNVKYRFVIDIANTLTA
ncbi:hypothetical protein RND81_06G010100 [Saponaria officinalis]|uniref:Enoyl reductase (ER) domain-containing protein n=1 Tax=Saponaria officinalis TaxID=3572 RepID=A0AAW1K3L8_SAPOF